MSRIVTADGDGVVDLLLGAIQRGVLLLEARDLFAQNRDVGVERTSEAGVRTLSRFLVRDDLLRARNLRSDVGSRLRAGDRADGLRRDAPEAFQLLGDFLDRRGVRQHVQEVLPRVAQRPGCFRPRSARLLRRVFLLLAEDPQLGGLRLQAAHLVGDFTDLRAENVGVAVRQQRVDQCDTQLFRRARGAALLGFQCRVLRLVGCDRTVLPFEGGRTRVAGVRGLRIRTVQLREHAEDLLHAASSRLAAGGNLLLGADQLLERAADRRDSLGRLVSGADD